MDERLEFGWLVPRAGYRWALATRLPDPALGPLPDVPRGPQPALVPVKAPQATALTEYRPPEWDPALFHAFAELKPGKEEILEFANRHGNLTHGMELQPAGGADAVTGSPMYGTLLF